MCIMMSISVSLYILSGLLDFYIFFFKVLHHNVLLGLSRLWERHRFKKNETSDVLKSGFFILFIKRSNTKKNC